MTTPSSSPPALIVSPPAAGFDRAGLRDIVKESGLGMALHRLVRAPFGHTVLTLRALDAVIAAGDLALQAGEALQGALLADLARSGSLALPEPTADQRLFIGAFQVTVLCDALAPRWPSWRRRRSCTRTSRRTASRSCCAARRGRRSRRCWGWRASTSSCRRSSSRGPRRRGWRSASCGW
jgi:hypothetical protein